MATTGARDASSAQRMAIASLLRMANADLADARLLLRRGQARNAAVIGRRAVAHLIGAVAVSENGWPPATGHEGVDAIPSVNPVQPGLVAAEALLADAADQDVEPDGELGSAPDTADISDALDDVEAILDTANQAFDVALSDGTAAANADPIRPPHVPDDAGDPVEPPNEEPEEEPEEADGPTAADDAPPPEDAPPADEDDAPVPGRVVRARGPKRRAAASGPETEPARRAVIVFGEPPRQPRKRKRNASAPIGHAITPAPPGDAAEARGKAEKPDASVRPTGGREADPGAHHPPHDYTSTVFWALMDRWKLSDLEALALVGHSGGMTKKGTRPRFKVTGQEARLFGQLREIDAALSPLVKDPGAWMRQPIRKAPFSGQSAVAYITRHGLEGAKEVARLVLLTGLRQQTSA